MQRLVLLYSPSYQATKINVISWHMWHTSHRAAVPSSFLQLCQSLPARKSPRSVWGLLISLHLAPQHFLQRILNPLDASQPSLKQQTTEGYLRKSLLPNSKSCLFLMADTQAFLPLYLCVSYRAETSLHALASALSQSVFACQKPWCWLTPPGEISPCCCCYSQNNRIAASVLGWMLIYFQTSFHFFISFFFPQHSLNTESHSKRSIWKPPLLTAKSLPALLALSAGIARQTKKRISVSTGSILLLKPSRLHCHSCFYIKDRFTCCCIHKSLTFKLCSSPFILYLCWLSQNKIKKSNRHAASHSIPSASSIISDVVLSSSPWIALNT